MRDLLRRPLSAEFWRQGDRCCYAAFAGSTCVHLGLIALLGMLWVASPRDRGVERLQTEWTATDTEVPVVEVPRDAPLLPTTSESTASAVLVQSEIATSSPTPDPERSGAPNLFATALPTEALADEVGAAPSGLIGEGSGGGDGSPGGFFGRQPTGKRFVYVVDCSRSMNHPHPEGKTRFGRVKIELVKSIATMDADMQFFVVFFNNGAVPMPAQSLQPATPQVQKYYLEWVAKSVAHGQPTDPREALALALSLQPDVIYFLTDGNFERRIQIRLAQLRQSRSIIHTFVFGEPAAEGLMRNVAGNNGGDYHFIP